MFTLEEDKAIVYSFTKESYYNGRMRVLRRILGSRVTRGYINYFDRFNFIKDCLRDFYRRYHYVYAVDDDVPNISDTESESSSDSESELESSDSDDDSNVIASYRKTTATTTKKRTINEMSEKELEEYEKNITEQIKKRKVEIEKEHTAHSKCPLCFEEIDMNAVIASCGHVYCTECYCKTLSRPLQKYTDTCHNCPVCRESWNKPNKVQFVSRNDNINITLLRNLGAKVSI
jgi:hypothetical protein